MRKLIFLFIIFAIISTLISCAEEKEPEVPVSESETATEALPESSEAETTSEAKKESKYYFSVEGNDFKIAIDADMKKVLPALGEPLKYEESPSCAFEGLDKTYTYSGFAIHTRPDGENDYVYMIFLTDDSVTTPEGIYIGSESADVYAAYGTPDSENDGLLSYTDSGTALSFVIREGEVVSIEYAPEG